ncbi:MAG: helix-turn-helix domain-containing protein [Blastocatellia bacterium]
MGNPAGVKRDFDELERRRLKAAELLGCGISEAEVARQVGVHRQSVNRWSKQLKSRGLDSLKQVGRAGRKPKLSESDLRLILLGVLSGAQAIGFPTPEWTAARVADLIERECGVKYSVGQALRTLKTLRRRFPGLMRNR